jgi:hypothetical protein
MRPLSALAIFAACLCSRTSVAGEDSAPRPVSVGTEVVREMNLARQHPEIYAGFLEEWRPQFRGYLRVLPGHRMLRTREGIGAVDEAIRFLRHTRPLRPLAFSKGMALAAAEHVADQANGAMGHEGSDFSNAGERMNRHGAWHTLWGENIAYGHDTPRSIVLALIVDDGQRARKHRKNIFNPAFTRAGAAIGPHGRYRTVCSMEFAAIFVEAGAGLDSLVARN